MTAAPQFQINKPFAKLGNHADSLTAMLKDSSRQLGLDLSEAQFAQLLHYLDGLLLWNKAYNLTAITAPVEGLIKHVIDCLAIIPQLPKGDLLDIGTGAGLPSVIVAICEPNRHCTALDSNQKKIRFIRQISSELGLNNVTPVAARIEAHSGQYDVITARAFASLEDFVAAAKPYLKTDGKLCAMKGKAPSADEIKALQNDWQITTTALLVPNLNDSRHLIELSPKND